MVHGDIEPFVSPVDGSVISDRKQLREHNSRNGVVSADEYSSDFLERKAKERADHAQGITSSAEKQERRQVIYENMIAAERKHGW